MEILYRYKYKNLLKIKTINEQHTNNIIEPIIEKKIRSIYRYNTYHEKKLEFYFY